ncbi:MAG: hypothetical protein QE263_04165 [Vampirovibrionales bacterium]|nr:hypothetical protein [Vampirovibrionales bacterium]
MGHAIINCIRCNRLVRQSMSGKCPECSVRENDQFSQMFRLLQGSVKTGGIYIKDISKQIGMPENIIEEYFLEGKLGTAAHSLRFSCKKCGVEYSGDEGHSSICLGCRATVSAEAGISIKGRNDVIMQQGEARRICLLSKINGTAFAPEDEEKGIRSDFSRNL